MAIETDDNEEQNLQDARLADRLLHIGRLCAAHLNEPFLWADHGTLLYDETGLPRPTL